MKNKEILNNIIKKLRDDSNSGVNPFNSRISESEKIELAKSDYASELLRYIATMTNVYIR